MAITFVIIIIIYYCYQCLSICCFCVQPNTTTPDGVNYTWHIPITAHVVISLSLADRVTGVRLN